MTIYSMMIAIRDVLRSDNTNLPTSVFTLTNKGIYVGKVRDDASRGPYVQISYTGMGKSQKINMGRATYKEDVNYVIRIQLIVGQSAVGTTYTTGGTTYKNDAFCLYFIEKIKTSLKSNQTTLATNGVRSISFRNTPEEPKQDGKWWRQNMFVVVKE